jgi:phage gpG-like protein
MALAHQSKVGDQGVDVVGFAQLNAALNRIGGGKADFGLEYELQRRIRLIGEEIAKTAPQFVTHKTGRHGDPSTPRLEDSVKVSVTANSASVYSTSEYGGIQNTGGGPHAGWAAKGPHVRSDKASEWMNKAVRSKEQWVEAQMDGLVDWLLDEFESDFY